jgi:transposase
MTKFYLGVDVGKYSHQAALINENGLALAPAYKFANQSQAINELCQTIKKQLPDKETTVKVGMEATGHYYWHLRDELLKQGFEVAVFNPIETQTKAKLKLRKVKNDRIDSLIIADLVREKDLKQQNETVSFNQPNEQLKELRQLTRFTARLKKQARFYKQGITVLLERICPEFENCFKNVFSKTALMVAREYFINNRSERKLINLMAKTSRGRIKAESAKTIIQILNSSLGLSYRNESAQLELAILLDDLETKLKQIQQLEQRIKAMSQDFKEVELIASIKGVSERMAAVIYAEIGNINRFGKKEQLTAFAGLDPAVKQSGTYLRKQGNHISKRGPKYLRQELYFAAKTAIIFDPELKAYYLKKKAEGKHYNCVMIAIARKILMRVWAVLKQNRPYEVRPAK